jgi:nitrate reductase gamma subunit
MTWLLPALLYVSAAAFLAGLGWRIAVWLRAPVPLKIVLTPAPATLGGVCQRLAGEVFFFRSLLRADYQLWAAAWTFHVSLVLLAVGHLGGLVIPEFARSVLGQSEFQFHQFAQITGGAAGILAVVPLLALLIRRLAAERLRYLSTMGDFVALALLLAVIATGNHMRFLGTVEIAEARRFVAGVLAFQPAPVPADVAFVLHVLLVCALLVYIPFSKLVHLGGLVLNPTLNQPNNPREKRHPGPWSSPAVS